MNILDNGPRLPVKQDPVELQGDVGAPCVCLIADRMGRLRRLPQDELLPGRGSIQVLLRCRRCSVVFVRSDGASR
jgi:hypothetical protein